jgi:hypothetical protein
MHAKEITESVEIFSGVDEEHEIQSEVFYQKFSRYGQFSYAIFRWSASIPK